MVLNFFTKKQPEPKKSAIDVVRQMKSQGLDNNQIVQAMQRDGYTSSETFDALQLSEQNTMLPPEQMPQPPNPMGFQPQSIADPSGYSMPPPPMMESQSFAPPQMQMAPPSANEMDTSQIEALIEAVIDEKWREIERSMSKVIDWKDSAEQQLLQLQQEIKDVKGQFDGLQKAMIGRIGDYDKNIVEVGAQLNAMEKAFSKFLPQFTENINELNRVTQRFKNN